DSRKQKKGETLIQEISLEKNHIKNLSSDQKSTCITNAEASSLKISTTLGLSNHVAEIPESSSESIPTESQVSDSSSSEPSQENDQDSELPEAEINASTEETKSRVSDSSISANSETEVNISNKSRPPISVLPVDPEKKRNHVIKMVLEKFPYLTLKYSNEYGDYFNCPKTCLVCNKEHKRDDVK
ncbi:30576_t:CDS:2, partial [Gigaspora margarita]